MGAIPSGHWHVELADGAKTWSVREDVLGPLDGVRLSARHTGDSGRGSLLLGGSRTWSASGISHTVFHGRGNAVCRMLTLDFACDRRAAGCFKGSPSMSRRGGPPSTGIRDRSH